MKSVFNIIPVALVALFAQATACKGLSLALWLHYGCISCTNFFLNATCAKLMQAFCTLQAPCLLACAINATYAIQFLKCCFRRSQNSHFSQNGRIQVYTR